MEPNISNQITDIDEVLRDSMQHDQDVEIVMKKVPHYLIRNGISLLTFVTLLFIFLASIIKYPEIKELRITLTSSVPPKRILVNSSGKIQNLFVKNNSIVQANQVVCVIENTANYDDILILKNLIAKQGLVDFLNSRNTLPSFLKLGEINSTFTELKKEVDDYYFYTFNDNSLKRIKRLNNQIQGREKMISELQGKFDVLSKQFAIQNKIYKIDSVLIQDKVISNLDFLKSQERFLSNELNSREGVLNSIENQINKIEFEKDVDQIRYSTTMEINRRKLIILSLFQKLMAEILEWEHKYIVKSPINGRIVFFDFWKKDIYIENKKSFAMVVPKSFSYICTGFMDLKGAGRVKKGQKVLIKLDSYPFEDFGRLIGIVNSISSVPLDDKFAVEVNVTNTLYTSSKFKIPPHSLLHGNAEIITDDKTIIERIFKPFMYNDHYHFR